MLLKDLLKGVKIIKSTGNLETDIKGIGINSKKIGNGFLFCAIPGFKKDGHDFAGEAILNGASALLVQKGVKIENPRDVAVIISEDTRKELAVLSANFYKNPSQKLTLCGITGTNGKTTTVFLTDSILRASGKKTSFITTIYAEMDSEPMHFDRTTPESPELNDFFYRSVARGVNAACMEVSSHSIDLHRVSHLNFDYFAFTNLTQDHLDYHETMERYFEVKSRLFLPGFRKIFGGKGSVLNIDDPYGKTLLERTDLDVMTCSIKQESANIKAANAVSSIDGIEMDLVLSKIPESINNRIKGVKKIRIKSALCGDFNICNIMTAAGLGIFCGADPDEIAAGVRALEGVPGRFEKISLGGRYAIIDYAHTPDGLYNVLKTARSLLKPGAKLICVFGCGGDRDSGKRKIMGAVAARLADFSIITSDNPRTEDPGKIIEMITEGFTDNNCRSYEIEADRKKAIDAALSGTGENDIVMIAGKGHEDYQEFSGKRIHFSDREVVLEWKSRP